MSEIDTSFDIWIAANLRACDFIYTDVRGQKSELCKSFAFDMRCSQSKHSTNRYFPTYILFKQPIIETKLNSQLKHNEIECIATVLSSRVLNPYLIACKIASFIKLTMLPRSYRIKNSLNCGMVWCAEVDVKISHRSIQMGANIYMYEGNASSGAM